ncbi:MarR family winged helix-turn-helix transcriptional regulator [Blautia sp. HCP3S3_G3]|uniref:MarR family winged helix-turn-helix transcriptional regulator n=1 Tax=Blautia sp. HCP3S3_G3 TaxID=3438913 RepID=UPI003F89FD1A
MERQIDNLLHGSQFKQLMEDRISQIREQYGLRKVDVEILYYLSGCGERNTSKDIKNDTKITKGHISQSVDRLQKMELLTFIPDENDRRCVHLCLTQKAEQVSRDITGVWNEMSRIVFEGVTEEEVKVLASVAAKIARNIDRAMNGGTVNNR